MKQVPYVRRRQGPPCACLTPPLPPEETTPKAHATVQSDVEPVASAETTEPPSDEATQRNAEEVTNLEKLEDYKPWNGDPGYCLEADVFQRRQATRTADLLIADQLPGLASCHDGKISQPELVRVEVAVDNRPKPAVSTSIATVTDCSVAQCLAERFEQMKWPAHLTGTIVDLVLMPDSPPRRVEARPIRTANPCGTPKTALTLAPPTNSISREIRSHPNGFRECYADASKAGRTPQGEMVVWLQVESEGFVEQAYLVTNSVDDCALAACVLTELKRLRFSKPEAGIATSIEVFRFAAPPEQTP